MLLQQGPSSAMLQISIVLRLRALLCMQLSENEPPPTLGQPYKWKKKHNLLDYDNNGYT